MKKILLVIIAICLLASAPLIYKRATTEINNHTYEIVVPYEEIRELSKLTIEMPHLLEELGKKEEVTGAQTVQAISLTPIDLKDLDDREVVEVFEKRVLNFHYPKTASLTTDDKSGLYVVIKDRVDQATVSRMEAAFSGEKDLITKRDDLGEIIGQSVYHIEGMPYISIFNGNRNIDNSIMTTPLGYDEQLIANLKKLGFETIFRFGNNITENNGFIFDELLALKEKYGANKILFNGSEVLGHGENKYGKRKMLELQTEGFVIMPIEFSDQRGFAMYEEAYKQQAVRLISIDPFDGWEGHVDRASRAVFERNIRSVLVHLTSTSKLYGNDYSPDEMMNKSISMIRSIHQEIQEQKFANYTAGTANPFEKLEVNAFMKLATIFGVAAFLALAALLVSRIISILTFLGIALIGLGYLFTDMTVLAQGLALLTGITAATYGVVSAVESKLQTRKDVLIQYFKSIGIGLIGAWFIVCLLFGNEFLYKFEEFRGVKVLYLLPIILVTLHLLKDKFMKLAVEPVRYYQLVIIGIVLGAMAVYLMRSGNDPAIGVSSLELFVRDTLESILGVRPRTKEFLIGFPIFILTMYLMTKGYKAASFLYIGASVAFVSMVNTFTHLHIPLYISMIRTVYGVLFGLIIGVVLIIVVKLLQKMWPMLKARL